MHCVEDSERFAEIKKFSRTPRSERNLCIFFTILQLFRQKSISSHESLILIFILCRYWNIEDTRVSERYFHLRLHELIPLLVWRNCQVFFCTLITVHTNTHESVINATLHLAASSLYASFCTRHWTLFPPLLSSCLSIKSPRRNSTSLVFVGLLRSTAISSDSINTCATCPNLCSVLWILCILPSHRSVELKLTVVRCPCSSLSIFDYCRDLFRDIICEVWSTNDTRDRDTTLSCVVTYLHTSYEDLQLHFSTPIRVDHFDFRVFFHKSCRCDFLSHICISSIIVRLATSMLFNYFFFLSVINSGDHVLSSTCFDKWIHSTSAGRLPLTSSAHLLSKSLSSNVLVFVTSDLSDPSSTDIRRRFLTLRPMRSRRWYRRIRSQRSHESKFQRCQRNRWRRNDLSRSTTVQYGSPVHRAVGFLPLRSLSWNFNSWDSLSFHQSRAAQRFVRQ